MFCPYCGTQNDNGAAFCRVCGGNLHTASAKPTAPAAPTAPFEPSAPGMPYSPTPSTTESASSPDAAKSIDIKKLALNILFYFLAAAAYFSLSVIILTIFSNGDAISANSVFDPDVSKTMSLQDFCSVMLNGNTFFNPTGISTAIAVGMYIMVYGTAPVAAIAFLSSVIGKKKGFPMQLLSVLFSVISAALLAAIVPVSLRFVPNLKIGLSEKLVMLKTDVGSFDYKILIIFAALILVMTLLTVIFTAIANKRREAK